MRREREEATAAEWQQRQAELEQLREAFSTDQERLQLAVDESERRSGELCQLSGELENDRDEFRREVQLLESERKALAAAREALEADQQELKRMRRDLEQERDELAEAAGNAQHKPETESEIAELRELLELHGLELDESIQMIRTNRNHLDTELQEFATRLELSRTELARVTSGRDAVPDQLDQFRRELDESKARIEQIFAALKDDRAALAQLREMLAAQRPVENADQREWIHGEVERAVMECTKPGRSRHTLAAQDSIRFQCSNCSTKLVVRSNYAGKRAVCKACDQTIVIPGAKA